MSDGESSYFLSGRHLWRTVIYRAMQEANGDQLVVLGWQTRGLDAEARRELREWHTGRIQRAARAYLTTDTQFLRRVVEMANLPETFDDFLKRMRFLYPKTRVN